jgi:hypothetical protein
MDGAQPFPLEDVATQRAERRALVCAWALWGLMMLVLAGIVLRDPACPTLNVLWRDTGQAWLSGHDLYGDNIQPSQVGYRYGPIIAASLSLLAWLPLAAGAILVRLVNAAVLLVATLLWARTTAPGKVSRFALAWFLVLLAVLALPNLECGQFNLLVAGLLIGALAAIDRDRWNVAAGLLALASVFKIYPLAFALLLVVVFPRQLLGRLAAGLAVVLGVPFLMQESGYVLRQYQLWFELLRTADNHRRFLPLEQGETYRDLLYLFRLYRVPMPLAVYTVIQAAIGGAFALRCWSAARRRLPRRYLLWDVHVLGTVYLTLCGPASEPRTYGLVAPALAWWTVWAYHRGPALARFLVAQACGLQLLGVLSAVTPESVMHFRSAGLHPLSALLLLAGHLATPPQTWLVPRDAAGPEESARQAA